ncbi:acetyl-CoA carboxyl transferase [bacterium BRH_c32]|nr:MAG: acetyl-CoA carboxyl transferase [bacterium BRH_c32]
MGWFKRSKQNISPESKKSDIPDGQWSKCGDCGEIVHNKQLEQNSSICPKCGFHFRIGSQQYFELLFDGGEFKELDKKMRSADPLEFTDTKNYGERIIATIKKTGLNDAIRTGVGKIEGKKAVISCMDFGFIGGSMGSVVGEKIARAIEKACDEKIPMILISQSGGARMMEGAYSLMQMAKTSTRLSRLSEMKLPFISVLTDPTTGGVTASYAMLGDVIIAEPKALIGFAGPRVIKQTIGRDLPEGFQRSEFLLENGFLDFIVNRKELKGKLSLLMEYFS